jgi:hypothetical protein
MEHQLHPSVSFQEGENSVSRSGENYVSVVTRPISWQDRSWNSPAGLVAAFRYGQPSQSGMIRALGFAAITPTRSDMPAAEFTDWGASPVVKRRTMWRAVGDRVAIRW